MGKAVPAEDKARLQAEGRWLAFCDERERMKAEGVSSREAAAYLLEGQYRPGIEVDEALIAPAVRNKSVVRGPNAPTRVPVSAGDETTLRELAAECPEDRTCSMREAIKYASENMYAPVGDLDPDAVPGRMAVTLLAFAIRTPTEFMRLFLSKLVPTGRDMDQQEKMSDDGRPVERTIDTALALAAQSRVDTDSSAESVD